MSEFRDSLTNASRVFEATEHLNQYSSFREDEFDPLFNVKSFKIHLGGELFTHHLTFLLDSEDLEKQPDLIRDLYFLLELRTEDSPTAEIIFTEKPLAQTITLQLRPEQVTQQKVGIEINQIEGPKVLVPTKRPNQPVALAQAKTLTEKAQQILLNLKQRFSSKVKQPAFSTSQTHLFLASLVYSEQLLRRRLKPESLAKLPPPFLESTYPPF